MIVLVIIVVVVLVDSVLISIFVVVVVVIVVVAAVIIAFIVRVYQLLDIIVGGLVFVGRTIVSGVDDGRRRLEYAACPCHLSKHFYAILLMLCERSKIAIANIADACNKRHDVAREINNGNDCIEQ